MTQNDATGGYSHSVVGNLTFLPKSRTQNVPATSKRHSVASIGKRKAGGENPSASSFMISYFIIS